MVAKLTGVIIDSESKEGIPFATVVIKDAATRTSVSSMRTDERGRFGFLVDETEWHVSIRANGFEGYNRDHGVSSKGKNLSIKLRPTVIASFNLRKFL